MEKMLRIVVALGGNALVDRSGMATSEAQEQVSEKTARQLLSLIQEGHEIVIVHGNGPQVGNILLQQQAADSEKTPAMPLDVCGAMSEGMIGYWIQRALDVALAEANINKQAATIITQTVVDLKDSAFINPTKPIGPFYSEKESQALMESKGYFMKEDSGRGWRRVVPSPDPKEIVEIELIKSLLQTGNIVITAGGGGIPVVRDLETRVLKGVEAVIDKDLAAAQLAIQVDADILLILTDVPGVAIDFRTPQQKNLGRVSSGQLQDYLDHGQFASGSMLPKVQATLRFVESSSKRLAVITSIDNAVKGLHGTEGTLVYKM